MSVGPAILRASLLDMQVCVPIEWTDEEIEEFAETENPSGTTNDWFVVKEGNKRLGGDPERSPCAKHSGFVHVRLEA